MDYSCLFLHPVPTDAWVPQSQCLGLSPIAVEWCFSAFPVRQGGEEKRAQRRLLKNFKFYCLGSSGSTGRVRGARNMKSMWPLLAANFFITYFHRAGRWGGMAPSVPLDPLLLGTVLLKNLPILTGLPITGCIIYMPTSLPNPDIHWSKRRKKLVSEQKLANRVPRKLFPKSLPSTTKDFEREQEIYLGFLE